MRWIIFTWSQPSGDSSWGRGEFFQIFFKNYEGQLHSSVRFQWGHSWLIPTFDYVIELISLWLFVAGLKCLEEKLQSEEAAIMREVNMILGFIIIIFHWLSLTEQDHNKFSKISYLSIFHLAIFICSINASWMIFSV